MRVLLDTHCWLWMLAESHRIPDETRALIADTETDVWVSAASAWEIAIKVGLGKLHLPEEPASFVPSRLISSGCQPLAITMEHAIRAGALPTWHRDPFDRMLIAQAQVLGVPICSRDRAFERYDVELLWS